MLKLSQKKSYVYREEVKETGRYIFTFNNEKSMQKKEL